MNTETPTSPELSFLAGGGSLAEIIAGFDWASTPLGPIGSWPISIKTTVGLSTRSAAIYRVFGRASSKPAPATHGSR